MHKYLLVALAMAVAITAAAAAPLAAQEPPLDSLMDPANNIIHPPTHSDISVRLDHNGKPLHLGLHETQGSTNRWHEFSNTFVFVPDAAKVTVPNPTGLADYGFLGPPGTEIWRLSKSSTTGTTIWLGISAESLPGQLSSIFQRQLTWRMDGVSGIDGGPPPGHFFVAASEVAMGDGASPIFSTRQGMPQAMDWIARSSAHIHASWDFTAAGVYCINMNVSGRLIDGTTIADQQVWTVIVGDDYLPDDPAQMDTCAQAGIYPSSVPSAPPTTGGDGKNVVGPAGSQAFRSVFGDFRLQIVEGELDVAFIHGSQIGGGTGYDPSSLVIGRGTNPISSHNFTVPDWLASAGQTWRAVTLNHGSTAGTSLGWDATRVSPDELLGDITWHLRGAYGTGDFVLYDRSSLHLTGRAVLSNRPGHEASSYALWPGVATREESPAWTFKGFGRYCLDMEWTATLADGTPVSTKKSLTFAIGVNPNTVELCTWQTPDPGPDPTPTPDPDPDPTPTPTPVPGGRVVLDFGHVDVQGVIEGENIDLVVKDDRDSPAAYYGPDEVTFYVSPNASYTVVSSAESFLGPVGAEVWVLPENPVDGLLWPGWNVDPDGTPVRWRLDSLRGPGEFALYFTAGLPPTPNVLMFSGDGLPDSFDYNQHGHGAWAFTAQGVYCLDLTIETLTAIGGTPTGPSDSGTLLFAVGDVDPASVTEADCGTTQGSGTTQTIQVNLLQDGGLTLSVAGDQVFMGQAQLNSGGNALVSSGALNTVAVVDMRLQTVQWNVNGSIGEYFVSGEDQFGGDALGWEPRVLASSCVEDVTPGGLVAPGVGLHSALLGQGLCRGTTELDALLELEIAVDTPPGEYSAVLTLTLI